MIHFNTRTSFIKARDPSILTGNLLDVTKKQNKEEERQLDVYLRLKGGVDYGHLYEIPDLNTLISIIPEGYDTSKKIKYGENIKRKYNFSKIFGPDTTQGEIFDELVKPKIFKFINGDNSTLMTYGVSGSGKTYTIIGTSQEPGVVPRSLEYIFQTLPNVLKTPCIKPHPIQGVVLLSDSKIAEEIEIKEQILKCDLPGVDQTKHVEIYREMQTNLRDISAACSDDTDVSIAIWVSFAEIYNEHIYDLLELKKGNKKSRTKLKLGNSNCSTYIKNLTCVHVSSGLEAYQALQYGLHRLNYAKTNINDHSSRSHSIFSVMLTQKNSKDDFCLSCFNFCDLAGAERSKKTMNIGQRLKESNNINTSLLVLGRCIAGVRNKQNGSNHQIIPFRESKLTQIFQNALMGHEDICMIVNINPCLEFFNETQHVLNFSAIAKQIMVIPQEQRIINAKRVSQEFRDAASVVQHNEARINELLNELSECCLKIEEEETDAQMEENMLRQELLAKHENSSESFKRQSELKYSELEKELGEKYKQKLKEAKSEFNECSDSSFSSDSSDEEIIGQRKRKHVDAETITVYSSDEESYLNLFQKKMENLNNIIKEHHETIFNLEAEIEKTKAKNEELVRLISERELMIEKFND